MSFPRIANFWALFAGGLVGSLIPIILLVVLFFMAKGWVVSALESFLPPQMADTATKLLFGFLGFYFLLRFLRR